MIFPLHQQATTPRKLHPSWTQVQLPQVGSATMSPLKGTVWTSFLDRIMTPDLVCMFSSGEDLTSNVLAVIPSSRKPRERAAWPANTSVRSCRSRWLPLPALPGRIHSYDIKINGGGSSSKVNSQTSIIENSPAFLSINLRLKLFGVICGPMKKLVSSLQLSSKRDTYGTAHPSALKTWLAEEVLLPVTFQWPLLRNWKSKWPRGKNFELSDTLQRSTSAPNLKFIQLRKTHQIQMPSTQIFLSANDGPEWA